MSYTTLLMLCITVLILTHINYKYTLGAHLMPEALFNRICSLLQWQIQGWFVTKITRNYWRWLQFEIAWKCAISENETHPSRVLYWRSSPLVGAITLYMSDILKSSTKFFFFPNSTDCVESKISAVTKLKYHLANWRLQV